MRKRIAFLSCSLVVAPSGLPGICGLDATVAGLVAYALFGPSRIRALGGVPVRVQDGSAAGPHGRLRPSG